MPLYAVIPTLFHFAFSFIFVIMILSNIQITRMKQFCNTAGLINILKVEPFILQPILPYSAILPFCRTAILPFCHISVLPFCHSAMASIPLPLKVCAAHLQRHTRQTDPLNLHFPLNQICTLMFQPLVLVAVYDG